jgi:hypothetical protein
MAEEGTLGLARAQESAGEELSKEDLQRRMGEARESISQTVTEIKDSVVHQYESVKETISETLDWREQFRKRPVAWAAGSIGAGFLTGYCLTSMIKGDEDCGHYAEGYEQARYDYQATALPRYSPQSVAAETAGTAEEDSGPGLISRIQETQAYDRLKNEASTIGEQLLNEVTKTAKEILVPAAVGFVKQWLEGLLHQKSATSSAQAQPAYAASSATEGTPSASRSYQPVTERSQ